MIADKDSHLPWNTIIPAAAPARMKANCTSNP
jgi:hypothetical protein